MSPKAKLSIAVFLGYIVCTASCSYAEGVHINTGGTAVSIGEGGVHVSDEDGSVNIDTGGVQVMNGEATGNIVVIGDDNSNSKKAQRKQPEKHTSYNNAELSNMSFEGKKLTGISFTNADLTAINFRNADLRGASFANADLKNCDFRGALVSGASFTNATFTGTKIGGVDFSSADMTNADMSGADYTADMPISAKAIQASLADASLAKINLAINFDYNKDTLKPDGMQQLAELGTALKSPTFASSIIRVEGHTDSIGSDEYNLDLSYRRAARVVRVLTEQYGIKSNLLEVKGHGEAKPIADNSTEFGRAQNRRVTIVNTSIARP